MPLNTLEELRTGKLAGSRRLKLAECLTAFPNEIFDLAETLEILDLSGNALSALPDDLSWGNIYYRHPYTILPLKLRPSFNNKVHWYRLHLNNN